MIVAEQTVELILQKLDEDDSYQSVLLSQFEEKYEDYCGYLGQEILPILNSEEGDLLMFVLSVIEEGFQRHELNHELFELTVYFDMEEKMWSMYEDQLKVPFRDRVTPYFDQIDEEEILAFVEDTLIADPDEESSFLGNTGRDIIWNVCASFVAVLIA